MSRHGDAALGECDVGAITPVLPRGTWVLLLTICVGEAVDDTE